MAQEEGTYMTCLVNCDDEFVECRRMVLHGIGKVGENRRHRHPPTCGIATHSHSGQDVVGDIQHTIPICGPSQLVSYQTQGADSAQRCRCRLYEASFEGNRLGI